MMQGSELLSTLYRDNTPARFWQAQVQVSPAAWQAAAEAAVSILPDGARVLEHSGWDGLMDHVLGEGQFGPQRFRLSRAKRLYYFLRPILPRQVTAVARHHYQGKRQAAFALGWPIEDRYVRFLYQMLEHVRGTSAAPGLPNSARCCAVSAMQCRRFWPNQADFAFVLTHDVETATGQRFVRTLADLD
ncbi:MAG: hypothetical protein M3328_04385, partial [Chloroflexota bacterium]|nr:hypothetical protein [Chloroflexota bacterium]